MEVAILSTASEEVPFTLQHFDTLDVMSQIDGNEVYSGYLNYRRKYDDTWIGYGLSYQLKPRLYIGASMFVSVKTMKYNFNTEAMAYPPGDSILVAGSPQPAYFGENVFAEEMKYWHISLATKLGIQYTTANERFGFGTNLTLPNIPVYGQADVRRSYSRGNIYDASQGSDAANVSVKDASFKERAFVKTPLSLSIGLQYVPATKKNMISIAVEYFSAIDTYDLIEGQSPITSTASFPFSSEFLSFSYSAEDVTNVAIGFKQFFSENFSALGGFRTDYSAQPNKEFRLTGESFTINRVKLDKFHITAGFVGVIKSLSIVSGVQYSRGRNRNFEQAINFSDPIEFNPVTSQALEGVKQDNASARLDEIGLFFGLLVEIN